MEGWVDVLEHLCAAHIHIVSGKPPSVADGLLHVWTLVPDPPVPGV